MPEERYQVRISCEIEDPAWDAFLGKTAGGHHVQTSLWSQVKSARGWRAVRLIITREEQIVAGAQLLLRPLPFVGAIGYVPKGPLFAEDDLLLIKLVFNQLQQIARDHRIQNLVVQLPNNSEALAQQLPCWGFQPSIVNVGPAATVLVDLTQDRDDILSQMKPRTRYNVRLGQRKGITVWEGTERDLHKYYELLMQTGQRQNFTPYPEEYFFKMWHVLNPGGFIKLFLAGLDGEIVSAQLVVPFGDTVINKLSVWSGHHGDYRPNEVLQWSAIEWSKSNGYRYYDFEGIDFEAAKAILQDESVPASLKQSVTSFKLGFGGEVVLMPGAYEYLYHPLVRWGYRNVFRKVGHQPFVDKIVNQIRTW